MVSDAVQHLNMMIEIMTVVICSIAEEQGSDVVKKKESCLAPCPFVHFFFGGVDARETKSALPVQTRFQQDPAADLFSRGEDSDKLFIELPQAADKKRDEALEVAALKRIVQAVVREPLSDPTGWATKTRDGPGRN